MYTFEREFKSENIDSIKEVYETVGWLGHNYEKIEKVFHNSSHVVIVKNYDEVIAIARALSDGVFNAAIYDVVVKKTYQQKGISRKMIEILLEDLKQVSCIHLISTTGNEELYRKLGFKKLKTGMAIYKSKKLDREYTE
ncbi:GCN5 family acetyltransferase [Mammaliicoccus sciuri]|nr:GNAT family N-acetyltransferase [Mammaliicoccus sciuri]KTT83195.1 GCN5 family acetyltransferase [Mammaliicoccus sciuri]KTT86726.1 GCN5 family acetyltransferase [Mammaliicoccus sciuri]KTT92238.1 GCN5 family acetyltransferase [Mammaliicoccus sciuri]KTT94368.1 GCN5 family acetyltransferase [Mammaliicoccus sciuri]KTW13214.1 GCN5 family acetyltransferase [Mammaliicoccus sciuri]